MSKDTIQFMMKKILHFESFEDRLVDLEKRNGDLEAHLKIVKNQLDKFTLNNNLIVETPAAGHSDSANFPKNPFDDAEILGNLNHTHNHDRREQFCTTATAPQVILEDDQVSTHHNHDQEQFFNRSTTVIEVDTPVNGSQDGINETWNDLQIGAAAADSGSNFAETENPFEDEILPNQNQGQLHNQSTTTSTTTTTAEAEVIFTDLNTILNGSQDDNVENLYSDVTIEKIEIKSEFESEGNEWDCASNTTISIDENVESASTGPQITSISSGRIRQIKSNVNLFIKNQTVPNVDSDLDPMSLSLCPSLPELSQNVIRAAQLDIRVRGPSQNYKNTRSKSKPKRKLGHNFTKKSRKFECKICTKSFTSLKRLGGHMHVHGRMKKKEKQMPKLFPIISRAEQLKIHSRIHKEGEKSYKSSDCPKKFNESYNLARHTRIHTEGKKYKCPDCPKKFTQSHNLVRHKRIHDENGGEEKSYKCSDCPKKFTQSHNLVRHKRICHTGENTFKCPICFKSFSSSPQVKIHIRIHTGEKPYSCTICFKKFTQSSSLARHRRIHNGEKPHGCQFCPKFFRVKEHLVIHTRMHTGEKPYECSICFRKFSRKQGLDKHIHCGHKKQKNGQP